MALSAWGRPRFPGPAARRPLPARLGRRDPLPRVPACGVLQSRPAAAPLWSQTPVRASHLTCPNPRPLRSPSPRPSSPPRPSGPRPPHGMLFEPGTPAPLNSPLPRAGTVLSAVRSKPPSLGTRTGLRFPRDWVPGNPFFQQTSRGFSTLLPYAGVYTSLWRSPRLQISYFSTAVRTI